MRNDQKRKEGQEEEGDCYCVVVNNRIGLTRTSSAVRVQCHAAVVRFFDPDPKRRRIGANELQPLISLIDRQIELLYVVLRQIVSSLSPIAVIRS